jgi:acyl-CoA reductase-like NAD-dependent aldehyde dehydrogenase
VPGADHLMHIGGAWVESDSGATMRATSPATGEAIGSVPEGTREDARRAIAAANAAARDWAARSAFERAEAMERVAAIVGERRDELARSSRWGRPARRSLPRTEDEALAIIDSGPYGLLASIFTEDLRRGLRFAEAARAGWVNVNEGSNYWESHLPFGGRAGSKSGVGRVGGRHAMDAFTEPKTVVLNLG